MKKAVCFISAMFLLLTLCGCMRSGLEPQTEESTVPETEALQTPAGQAPATETTVPTAAPETVAPTAPQPIPDESLFPMDFYFSSGAGAWGTALILNSDLSFSGSFHDSDMGDMTDEYPNGTCYVSTFSGNFQVLSQIDEYSYALELTHIETEIADGTIWIEDGIRYIACEAYGLEGTEYVLYLPETPTEQLPESMIHWLPYWGDLPQTLSCYAIWNTTYETPFFTYD